MEGNMKHTKVTKKRLEEYLLQGAHSHPGDCQAEDGGQRSITREGVEGLMSEMAPPSLTHWGVSHEFSVRVIDGHIMLAVGCHAAIVHNFDELMDKIMNWAHANLKKQLEIQ